MSLQAEATEPGASIHEQLLTKLNPQDVIEEVTEDVVEETESEDQVEVEAEVSEETTEETQEVDEELEVETLELSDVAASLGYDIDRLDVNESNELVFKTKIDGEEGQATLNELVKNHQLEGHLNKQNMEVTERKKALDTQIETNQAQHTERLQQAEDLTKIAYNELLKDYQNINWQELKDYGDGSYADKQAEYTQRQQSIGQLYQQIQDQRAAEPEPSNVNLEEEKAKLVDAMKWETTEAAQKGFAEIADYAVKTGYTREEVSGINDHRIFVALNKAAKYDELQKTSPRITNKVKKAPKLVKPSTAKVKDVNSDKVKDLRANISRQDGKHGSVAKFLLASGKIK